MEARPLRIPLLRGVLEAVPMPLFLVDFDLRVLEANTPAVRLAREHGGAEPAALQRLCEMLCCHIGRASGGCGDDVACRRCDIRTSVGRAVYGGARARKRILLSTAPNANGGSGNGPGGNGANGNGANRKGANGNGANGNGARGNALYCLLVVSPLNQDGRRLALVTLVPAGAPGAPTST